METKYKTIKVISPSKGKALKITQDKKLVMYMITDYYEVPTYKYTVEEVDIEEYIKWKNGMKAGIKNIFKFLK